jgi:hypothetical protein
MGATKINDAKRKGIIRYLKKHSQQATAKHFDISSSTVNGIANAGTVKKTLPIRSEPKVATEAHKSYAKADRLVVLNNFMGKLDTVIKTGDLKPGNFRDLAIALGTTLDKYRIEEKDEDTFGKEKAEVNAMFEMMRKEAAQPVKST